MAYLKLLLFMSACLLAPAARALERKNFRFWAGDIPPYCYLDSEQQVQGTVLKVFQTLVDRLGFTQKVEVLPWKRVLIEAQKDLPIFFIPVARTPEREKIFSWIGPMLDESFVVFTLKDRVKDARDLEQIRRLHVCTLRGSATEEISRHHRLPHVEMVGSNDTCARLLKAGRVDAWLAAKRGGIASFDLVGFDATELSVAMVLADWPLYLAASKSIPEDELERWRAELRKMKADGSFERLLH